MTLARRSSSSRHLFYLGTASLLFLLAFHQFHNLLSLTEYYGIRLADGAVDLPSQGRSGLHAGRPHDVLVASHFKGVTCDSTPCDGFFAYSPPNYDKHNATETFKKASATYNYGGAKNTETLNNMIFMPSETHAEECVKEWKENRNKWVDRGMSANAEDITIFDAFFNSPEFMNRNHTYMEIGAHDGVRESNSRFYDVCLGWNGLLVEPHPKNYERTVQLRPNAHHLGIAPSCMGNETGTISFPEHMYTSAQVNEEGSKLEIHCGPLQHYLDALGIRHVDFWSLDVEGSELNVLKTVNFDRTQIDVIIAESDNRLRHLPEFQQKVKDVRIFLQSKGYLMLSSVKVHKSDVFLRKGSCSHHRNIAECKPDP